MKKKSLKLEINKILVLVVGYEINPTGIGEHLIKGTISHKLADLISDIKACKYAFDITATELKKVDVIIESPLNLHPECGPVINKLLTGEDERKIYFEV